MSKLSFITILSESLELSRRWTMLSIFGFLVALPLALEAVFLEISPPLAQENITRFLHEAPLQITTVILCLLFINVLGKSGLIIILDDIVRKRNPLHFPSYRHLFRSALKACLIDLLVLLFLACYFFLLSLPILLSLLMDHAVPETLYSLVVLAFFPVATMVFVIREFAYYYYLLSPLRLTSAIRTATNLFVRHFALCLAFVLFFFLIVGVFTFFANIVMLGIVVLSERIAPTVPYLLPYFLGSTVLFTWYGIFRQILWFFFFTALAAPKDETPQATPAEKETIGVPTV